MGSYCSAVNRAMTSSDTFPLDQLLLCKEQILGGKEEKLVDLRGGPCNIPGERGGWSHQNESNGGDKKCLHFVYILNIGQADFFDGLDERC